MSEITFYYLDEVNAFNYDSDIDSGEDEIELLFGGICRREIVHKRSWVDGGGHRGKDVRQTSGEGTWAEQDGKLKINWTKQCVHKGGQPGQEKPLTVLTDGNLQYRCSFKPRIYKRSDHSKMGSKMKSKSRGNGQLS